ncbi:MAG: hypothetical protein U0S50_09890 [Sphingopyxis sp.]|uniref:hypothetical protein n=1 Tax=Sphingopyxis sp. TaxID=1908224 RepID=UPI002AB7FE89|nr:hypothetical protein [Sphingopyxis sp.]MDZ3832114.1 hypothetical protein [Sphingopyxis sp.]
MNRPTGLGSRLRLLVTRLDEAVEQSYRDAGLDFRPRYFPYFQLLMDRDSASVGECVAELGFTQPAATQTLQAMTRSGLIEPIPGRDRRERRYILSAAARAMIPELERIWQAAARAADILDDALPHPLGAIIDAALVRLERTSFHHMIAQELRQ